MQVRKVTLEDSGSTYCCMSEVPPNVAWAEALPESREWLKGNLGKHVEGYHLLHGDKVVGHIYYATSESALIPYEIEPETACIYCTEVLKDYMHRGYGKMMFDYMKNDLRKQGFRGIVIPATDFKEWMYHELFVKQGFRVVKEHPPYRVMYFPLTKDRVAIKVLKLSYKPSRDKAEVTLFRNFFCPVGAYMYHLTKRVAQSFGDKVKVVEIEATLETVRRYRITDSLINGKIKIFGPASEEDVKKAIQEEIDQLRLSGLSR